MDGIGVRIGEGVLIGRGSGIVAHESVEIGDGVYTGHHVYITDANHGYEDTSETIGRQFGAPRPVKVGAGSWLGHGSIVLPGAEVGRHVVVGAGAVVTGALPDFSVAVGNPARVIRRYVTGEGWVRVDEAAASTGCDGRSGTRATRRDVLTGGVAPGTHTAPSRRVTGSSDRRQRAQLVERGVPSRAPTPARRTHRHSRPPASARGDSGSAGYRSSRYRCPRDRRLVFTTGPVSSRGQISNTAGGAASSNGHTEKPCARS